MSENRNCVTGRDIVVGDVISYEVDTKIIVHGFQRAPKDLGDVKPDFRLAAVTINNSTLFRTWAIHDKIFYQLCNR